MGWKLLTTRGQTDRAFSASRELDSTAVSAHDRDLFLIIFLLNKSVVLQPAAQLLLITLFKNPDAFPAAQPWSSIDPPDC